MWKSLYAIRDGNTARTHQSIYKNLPIEHIIAMTWQPKEKVPAVAAPQLGESLSFLKTALTTLQDALEAFGLDLKDNELRLQAFPHPISGALDFQ